MLEHSPFTSTVPWLSTSGHGTCQASTKLFETKNPHYERCALGIDYTHVHTQTYLSFAASQCAGCWHRDQIHCTQCAGTGTLLHVAARTPGHTLLCHQLHATPSHPCLLPATAPLLAALAGSCRCCAHVREPVLPVAAHACACSPLGTPTSGRMWL